MDSHIRHLYTEASNSYAFKFPNDKERPVKLPWKSIADVVKAVNGPGTKDISSIAGAALKFFFSLSNQTDTWVSDMDARLVADNKAEISVTFEGQKFPGQVKKTFAIYADY